MLAQHPHLVYSEYGTLDPNVRSEDLTALSYSDSSFDLLITAESLEHVPDIDRGLSEIHRVLRPGGIHVFTVPVVWDGRKTRRRAAIKEGTVEHLLPPSFHGLPGEQAGDMLVFYEYGADFVGICERHGFAVELLTHADNPALVTFLTTRT